MPDERISEAFVEVVKLAERLGAIPINSVGGCWEHQIDDHWWIAVNGHAEPVKSSRGPVVSPFIAYLEFNGWPAGMIHPYGGTIAAGALANEDAFINAVKKA